MARVVPLLRTEKKRIMNDTVAAAGAAAAAAAAGGADGVVFRLRCLGGIHCGTTH